MRISSACSTVLLGLAAALLLAPAAAAAEKVKSLPIVDKAIEYHGGSLYASSEITSRVDGDRF
jgi:hypothetical protein